MSDPGLMAIVYLGGAGVLAFLVDPFDALDARDYKSLIAWGFILVAAGLGIIHLGMALGLISIPMQDKDIVTTGILAGLVSVVFFLVVFGLKKVLRR